MMDFVKCEFCQVPMHELYSMDRLGNEQYDYYCGNPDCEEIRQQRRFIPHSQPKIAGWLCATLFLSLLTTQVQAACPVTDKLYDHSTAWINYGDHYALRAKCMRGNNWLHKIGDPFDVPPLVWQGCHIGDDYDPVNKECVKK